MVESKYDGYAVIEELRAVEFVEPDGSKVDLVVSRLAELKIIDKNTDILLSTHPIPYGSKLYIKNGDKITKKKTYL